MLENKSSESTARVESVSVREIEATPSSSPVHDQVHPNPEVKPKLRRKHLTAEYKLRILSEVDRMGSDTGRIAAHLRREGLYASHLSAWRRQRSVGAYAALSRTRGRKPAHDAKDLEIAQLRKENDKLTTWKRHAELIMDAQKKIALILGNPIQEETLPKLPRLDQDEVNS
jgi:transposase